MINKLYAVLASLVQARINCDNATPRNDEWFAKHEERIEELVKDMMPSGSGIDNGTQIDIDACTPDKLVFHTAFHHMNDNGCYDGWTEHKLIVTPRLANNFTLRITGRDRNDIKEYLHDVFHAALDADVDMYATPTNANAVAPRSAEGSAAL